MIQDNPYTTEYLESIRPSLVSYANQRFEAAGQRVKLAADRLIDGIGVDVFDYRWDDNIISPCPNIVYHLCCEFSEGRNAYMFKAYTYGTSRYDYTWDEFLEYLDDTYGDYEYAEFMISMECIDPGDEYFTGEEYFNLGTHSFGCHVGDIRIEKPIGDAFIDEIFFHLVYNDIADDAGIQQLCMELIDSFADFVQTHCIGWFKRAVRDWGQ